MMMENMHKIWIRVVAMLCVCTAMSACSMITAPKPMGYDAGLLDGAPSGSPAFRYGWKEGCHSGLAAYGSMHYKMTYDFSYDVAALNDDEYQRAWELGFRHCRWYVSSWS